MNSHWGNQNVANLRREAVYRVSAENSERRLFSDDNWEVKVLNSEFINFILFSNDASRRISQHLLIWRRSNVLWMFAAPWKWILMINHMNVSVSRIKQKLHWADFHQTWMEVSDLLSNHLCVSWNSQVWRNLQPHVEGANVKIHPVICSLSREQEVFYWLLHGNTDL